uniref:Non-structural protein 4 n=1 Tax=Feitosa virus TaxID=2976199 RepID=A0A9E8DE74_9VIRU|nr:hypothetical protein 1 [Feitosa virus]
MADFESDEATTRSILFVSELGRSLDIDIDTVKKDLGLKLLSRSAAITSEFENHVVNDVKEKILKYKHMSKEIRLDQRLSDSDKTKLLTLFSPPYKLNFSRNASDIGAHMYYRSLNEIATFRCYDILCGKEKCPINRDVLVKEVGASVMKIVKYDRKNVHACTPNLTMDDSLRITNTARSLESIIHDIDQPKARRELAKTMLYNPKHRCFNKSEHCRITSKYLIFAHSTYDCSLTALADMMDSAEAVRAMGFFHYSPAILSNLTSGSDNGLNWKLDSCTFKLPINKYGKMLGTVLGHCDRLTSASPSTSKFLVKKNSESVWGLNKPKFNITFWFDNDYQNAYVHDLDTYLGLLRKSICTSSKGAHYMIRRTEHIGGLLFYEIVRSVVDIPRCNITRMIPLEDPENIIVHYYQLQNDPKKYHYHELIPDRLVVPKKFFERVYYYLYSLSDGKFTVQNAVTMASTMATRTVVNGSYVTQPYNLSIDLIDKVSHAIYFIVYCRRYDLMLTLKKLKAYEDLRRNPTIWNRLNVVLHRARNYVFGHSVEELKIEETFEDVVENGSAKLLNESALEHSTNILQWVTRLFRINQRYNVNFFPITRVVSIDEDISTMSSLEMSLPILAPETELQDLDEFIRERLHIDHVDTEICTVNDHKCNVKTYALNNHYNNRCLLYCFCNRHNISIGDLQLKLLNSKYFSALFMTTQISVRKSILGPVSDLILFELIACEFNVNICLHTENKHVLYDVNSSLTYHFSIRDNHCTELRECVDIQPYEFAPTKTPVSLMATDSLSVARAGTKEDKFKMYSVVVENFFPYVSRSAYTLHELDANYGIVSSGNVCELSAAPGAWLQYLHLNHSQLKLFYTHYVGGVDFRYEHADLIHLCECSSGDLTDHAFFETFTHEVKLHDRMDTLLSDVIMESDGNLDLDKFLVYQNMVFENLAEWLNDSGSFVMKTLAEIPLTSDAQYVLKHFDTVKFVKPNFSSPISTEYYIVAIGFHPDRADTDLPDVDYTSIPNSVMNKVISKCNMFVKNKYPFQKPYSIPIVNPKPILKSEPLECETPSAPEIPEPEPIPLPLATDSFEDKLVKLLNTLEIHDVPKSKLVMCVDDSLYPDGSFDSEINFFATDLITDSDETNYVIYNVPKLLVDFSTVNFRDMLTNLIAIATKLNTFRWRMKFDLTALDDKEIVDTLTLHITEQFSRHEVYIRTRYTNCSASISDMERSILEYISYTKTKKSENKSTFRYWYDKLAVNDFVLSHTIKYNVSVDTQNISVLYGKLFKFKHDKAQDSYTHVYCGHSDNFIPFDQMLDNRYYFVGDYTHKMFDDILVERVSAIDLHKLSNTQFVLVQGVAGHGKTYEIVSKHRPSLKNARGDLLVTPTTAGKQVLIDRTAKRHKLSASQLDSGCYRTITSFLMHTEDPKDFVDVYVDEAIMVHLALVIAVAYYSGASTVFMYGDATQIPAHSHIGSFEFKFHAPQNLFSAKAIRNKSFRIPADVAATLDSVYRDVHEQFDSNLGIVTTSTVLRSLNVVRINDISEMKNYYSKDVKYLTFTHTTANDLRKLDPCFESSTIAAYQGSENPEIAIVRTSISEADQIYNNVNICVTALTRHTKKLTYYTTCPKGDFMSKAIDNANRMTDLAIKGFSTTATVGSIHGRDYVVKSVEPSVDRFFKSRSNFTHSYTFADHRTHDTAKSFVHSLSSITNDIFVHKSIFTKFTMPEIIRWIKKIAPHVKQVYVRVHNEPFVDNAQVTELVEEYKCKNVIPTVVVDSLVPVTEVESLPEIHYGTCISVNPNIEMLQVFMSHLFPDQVYVPNNFDAYFVHSNDIEYTLKDMSFSMVWDRAPTSQFDCLTPILSTPAPAKRDVTFREIILGLMKRNLNPPQMIENACPENVAHHLLQNFTKMLVPGHRELLNEMESIIPTTHSIVSWLEKQDRSVLKSIANDIPICLASLTNCALSLKRNPKVRIAPNTVEIYDSVQTITCHPKFVNAYFCSVVEIAQDRLLKLMLPWFHVFTKKTNSQFGEDVYRSMLNHGKAFMFSGDDSLLMNGNNFKEMDMSKFDKSQLIFALEFLKLLFIKLGVPPYIAQLYYEMMFFRICRDPMNKVSVILTPQMESGSAATYFGNTCFCAAVVLSCLDLDDYTYTPKFEKFSLMFNLEVKEFSYANPYFCSKFVIVDEYHIKFLPDPIKILIKLGRSDLKNFVHVKEFHTSLKDLVSQYKCVMDMSVVSAAIRERYGFPYDCTYLIQNLIDVINNDNLFSKLFYCKPGDVLDMQAMRFSDY